MDQSDVEFVSALDANVDRPDDTVLFALPRHQAKQLLDMLHGMLMNHEVVLDERELRQLADRIQSSYLADRALVASDLSLSFTVCRNMIYLLERYKGGLIPEHEGAMVQASLGRVAASLSSVYRRFCGNQKIPNMWKLVETRIESLN